MPFVVSGYKITSINIKNNNNGTDHGSRLLSESRFTREKQPFYVAQGNEFFFFKSYRIIYFYIFYCKIILLFQKVGLLCRWHYLIIGIQRSILATRTKYTRKIINALINFFYCKIILLFQKVGLLCRWHYLIIGIQRSILTTRTKYTRNIINANLRKVLVKCL